MDNLCEMSDEDSDQTIARVKRRESALVAKEGVGGGEERTGGKRATTSACLSTSPLQSVVTSRALLPQQAIRSELRRDFLRLLSSLHKRKVWLRLYECPLVLSATFDGCDHNFSHLFLSSFQTPIGVEKCAVVRTDDCIELEFTFNNSQQNKESKPK